MAYLGIDIGCISLKFALAGDEADTDLFQSLLADHADLFQASDGSLPTAAGRPLLVTSYRRIKGSPSEATQSLLDELFAVLPEEAIAAVRVTGSGGRLIGEALGAAYENEFKAIARGLAALHPEVATVFEMGGETSKFIRLDTDCTLGRVGISDYSTNGDCAAGTGSFMDQQASRLLYDIEDVGRHRLRRRQGGQHRRALQRVRQERHDPRPAEGLRAAGGAARPLRRRHPQLPRHHHQGQGHPAAGGVHRRRGGQPGRRAGRARGLRLLGRRPVRAAALRMDGRRRRRPHPG